MLKIAPVIVIIVSIISMLGYLPGEIVIGAGIIQLMIVGSFLKKINAAHNRTSKTANALLMYEKLLNIIENETFTSKYLIDLQEQLKSENLQASTKIKALKKVVKSFDNRMNLIYAVLSNFFIMQDLQLMVKLENLKTSILPSFTNWFSVIAEFDAIFSFANYANNNPSFCTPKLSEKAFELDIKNGGHPLLHHTVRVSNSFQLGGLQQMAIVTGANMAGKSTFLRSTGTNLILAATGAPVCADEYTFSPINIFTSVRASDSLHKNESYFFAELQRLKKMIEKLKSGEKLFIILDEMLRGTNSKDKHAGSRGLIEQLIQFKASGLVATHDIELGNLIEQYPKNIINRRFEAAINDGKLTFDYTLKEGVSQNLNAVFLMRKYGIISQ